MSEEFETQQPQDNTYQDPIASTEGKPEKKKGSTAANVTATVVSVVVFYLFGLVGGLICYGGYWAVRAVIMSKMSVAAKVILSIILVFVFLALMVAFILFVAAAQANL